MKALGAALAAALLAGCTTASTAQQGAGASRTRTTHPTAPSTGGSGSLPTCALDSLPRQAQETARLVAAGGPFRYRRNDGVTYYNRNKVLPQRPTGTYREFTVTTPGASTRGTRRLVTDGNPTSGAPTTSPSAWYYTGDHYATFCTVTGTP